MYVTHRQQSLPAYLAAPGATCSTRRDEARFRVRFGRPDPEIGPEPAAPPLRQAA
jgi:hypothetical protein